MTTGQQAWGDVVDEQAQERLKRELAAMTPTCTWREHVPGGDIWLLSSTEWDLSGVQEDYALTPIHAWPVEWKELVIAAYAEAEAVPVGHWIDVSWPPTGSLWSAGRVHDGDSLDDAVGEDGLFNVGKEAPTPEVIVDEPATWRWYVDVTLTRFELDDDGTVHDRGDDQQHWCLGSTESDPTQIEYASFSASYRSIAIGDSSSGEESKSPPPPIARVSRYAILDADTDEVLVWVDARDPRSRPVAAGSDSRPSLATHAMNIAHETAAVGVLRRCAGDVHTLIEVQRPRGADMFISLPLPTAQDGRVLGYSLHRAGCGVGDQGTSASGWDDVQVAHRPGELLWGDCLRGEPCRPEDWRCEHRRPDVWSS